MKMLEEAGRKTVHRPCPLCGFDNRTVPVNRYSEEPWALKECVRCGFVYLERSPIYEELSEQHSWDKTARVWKEERLRDRKQVVLSTIGKRIRRGLQLVFKRRRMEGLLVKYSAPGNILDIGCGKGDQLKNLPANYIPFGIEISQSEAQYAVDIVRKCGGGVIVKPATEALFTLPDNFFSGVMMRSYLEHELEPKQVLRGVYRVLKPGGKVIVKVPNYGSVNRRLFGKRWCGFRFPEHLNYFTPKTLRDMCNSVGLKVWRLGFFDHLPTDDNMWLIANKKGISGRPRMNMVLPGERDRRSGLGPKSR